MKNFQPIQKIPLTSTTVCLLLLAIASFHRVKVEAKLQDSCHLRELELCAVGAAALFQNPNGIPLTTVEFDRQCEYLDESVDCLEDYAETCLTKTQRSLFGLISNDFQKLQEDFCQDGSELRQNYTKFGTCFREVQRKFQHVCVTDLQVGFESIHKLELSRRLSTFCCNVNRFKGCIMDRIEATCGPQALSFVETIIRRAASNALTNLCRNYDDDFDGCKKFLPEAGTKPYGLRIDEEENLRIVSKETDEGSRKCSKLVKELLAGVRQTSERLDKITNSLELLVSQTEELKLRNLAAKISSASRGTLSTS